MSKAVGGTACRFPHDPDSRLRAAATGGQAMSEFVSRGELPLAMARDTDTAAPRRSCVHADHLGTPRELSDAGGNLV